MRIYVSKFLKDLNRLRVINEMKKGTLESYKSRLFPLSKIPLIEGELVRSKLYKRNDDLYIIAGECCVGIASAMVLGKEHCT